MFPTQEAFGKFYEENIPARDTHRHKNANLDSREASNINALFISACPVARKPVCGGLCLVFVLMLVAWCPMHE